MSAKPKLTPHQKIMRAFRDGLPLRLSCADVVELARDHAIIQCALNDDEQDRERAAGAKDGA